MPGRFTPTVTVLRGEEGVIRPAHWGRFAVADPQAYEGTLRDVHVDGLELSGWSTTPVAGSVLPSPSGSGVMLIAVLDGELECLLGEHRAMVGSGQLCVMDATKRVRIGTRVRTRLLRIVVPRAIVPPQLHPVDGIISATGSTPLSRTLTLLAEDALEPRPAGATSPTSRALRALTVAMLEEIASISPPPDPRAEIIAYIERNLSNPELSPHTIADAFGISIRWVHHLFNTEQDSVARFIRLRRLDVVAAELAADRRFPRINLIAERNGFASRDGLTRAFKARYGMPIADYAELATQGRPPTPLGPFREAPAP